MVKGRSEEDTLCLAPIKVTLGGKEWDVKPLSIKKSREWRVEFAKTLSEIPKWVNVTSDTPDDFAEAMNAMMVDLPDRVSSLFFQYAEDLKKEEIEAVATDFELAKAFEEVAAYAFPLAGALGRAMMKGAAAPAKSSSSS